MSRSATAVAAVALAALVVAGPACVNMVGANMDDYVEREEKHFSVAGKPDVSLRTFDGAIEVRPWDRPEVQVVIEKHGRDKDGVAAIEVHAEQSGNHVEVAARQPLTQPMGTRRSAKLIVSVPATADVTASSGDGKIDIEALTGRLQLKSGDGDISVRQVSGDLDVHTGDGNMTVSGKLTGLNVSSGDGTVTVQADPGSTTSADWDIATGDGAVTLEIPDGFGAELEAHTGDGHIQLEDVPVSDVTGPLGGNSVRGRLGAGGGNLHVRTGDGSITLRKRS